MKKTMLWLIALSVLVLIVPLAVVGQDAEPMIEIVPPYGEIVSEPTEEIWFVAPFTRECVALGPMTCMLVKQNPEDEWQNFFDRIENFAYSEGFSYELRVMVVQLNNVPPDASARFVQLVEIISKTAAHPLIGRTWQLETMNGEAIPTDAGITIRFADDGSVGGSGGCNNYGGAYTLDDTQLSVEELFSTLMACENMEQESTFLDLLHLATSYQINGSQLLLMNAEGELILGFRVS